MPLLADTVKGLYSSLVVAALVIAGLVLGKDILIPLAISACFAFILSPIVVKLSAKGVPHAVAASGVVLIGVGFVAAIGFFLAAQIVHLTGDLATYKSNLVHKVRSFTQSAKSDGAIKRATDTIEAIGRDISKEITAPTASIPATTTSPATTPDLSQPSTTASPTGPVVVKVADDDGMTRYLSMIAHPLALAGLTLLFTWFALVQSADLRDRLIRVAGTDNLTGTTSALTDAGTRLSVFFLAQASMNVAFGVVVGGALWLIGVPYAALWAGLSIVMRFVPFIGSIVAAVPPLLLAAAVDPGWTMVVLVLALFAIGEPLMGQVIEPLMLGPKAGLSPFAMLVAASFWTLVWGPVGLILAAPLTLTLVVLGRYIPALEFATVLLGDEPALAAHEQLYHRLLSGDSLGATQQLETALAAPDASLAGVVDAMVLPALSAASLDLARGQIDRDRAEALRTTAIEVAHSISDLDPVAPPASGDADHRPSALIVPARSPLDIAAASIVTRTVSALLPVRTSAILQSTGLTAISNTTPEERQNVSMLVVVTTSAADAQYMPLIVKRAQRAFPSARVAMLSIGGARTPASQSEGQTGSFNFTTLAQIVEQLSPQAAQQDARAA